MIDRLDMTNVLNERLDEYGMKMTFLQKLVYIDLIEYCFNNDIILDTGKKIFMLDVTIDSLCDISRISSRRIVHEIIRKLELLGLVRYKVNEKRNVPSELIIYLYMYDI